MLKHVRQLISSFRHLFSESKYIASSELLNSINTNDSGIINRLIIQYFAHYRQKYNKKYIKKTQQKGLSWSGCALDKQQIEAVVACEDAQLVLASAGSGKTLSLLAKIDYIHSQLHVSSEQILAISFTKKTVSELTQRCSVKGVEFRTFHSLGNNILRNIPSELGAKTLISEQDIAKYFSSIIHQLCSDNRTFARAVNNYILFYFSAPQNPGVFKNDMKRISFNRQYLRRALKDENNIPKNPHSKSPILNGDFIRSKEDQLVAN